MKGKFIFSLLLCLPLVAQALAPAKASPKAAMLLEQLQQQYKMAKSLEAEFQQEVYQAALARTKTSKGSLRLQKPQQMRWEIYEPEASIMVSNGRKLWYYTPGAGKKGQVLERSAKELSQQPLFRLLVGNVAWNKEFRIMAQEQVAGIKAGEKLHKLTLKPLKDWGDLIQVKLSLTEKALIQELILENSSGNTTKIHLQSQSFGDKLPAALFEFKAPQGTEILKN